MIFKKYPVSTDLQSYIAYFWTLESQGEEANQIYRFVPDGSIDWIFHLGTPWTYWFPETHQDKRNHRSHLFGQIKRYLDLQLPNGKLFLLGVSFHPWAARLIWRFNLDEVTNNSIALAELDDASFTFLEEKIHQSDDLQHQIKLVEHFVRQRISPNKKESLAPIIQQMNENFTRLSLSNFSIKKRRLEQRFKAEIGISPKRFQRTIRINKIIHQLIQQPQQSLTQLAYDFNFFDQSHFISDFKQFTDCSPRQFLKSIEPSGPIYNFRATVAS